MSNINKLVNSSYKHEQTLRDLIYGEYDAIKQYQEALTYFKHDNHAYKIIEDIMNEEKVHVQELQLLLNNYDKYIPIAVKKAKKEANEK